MLNIRPVRTEEERSTCAKIMAGSEPWITLGMSGEHLLNTLNDPLNEVYAAKVKEEIVGTMVVQTRGALTGYLKSIAVKPDRRGRKLGEQMMAFIEKEIFSTCVNLFLCVSSFNQDAQRFYLKLGYEEVGTLKNYLVEGHDEILMRKTIAPILERSRVNPGT